MSGQLMAKLMMRMRRTNISSAGVLLMRCGMVRRAEMRCNHRRVIVVVVAATTTVMNLLMMVVMKTRRDVVVLVAST